MRHALAASLLLATLVTGAAQAGQHVISFEPDGSDITFLLDATGP